MLKFSQQHVFNQIVHAIEELKEKRIILQGSAGTGKTFLAKILIEYFADKIPKWDSKKIFVTAPTNKALSILQTKIGPKRGLVFKTTHAALKLKRNVNPKTGVVNFAPAWSRERPFENCILAIVDECSMLNTQLIQFLDEYSFPIIFIGDSKQINPVGELKTPIFERNYPVFELTEIIRQGTGNPIIDLSRDLDMIWFKEDKLIEDKGYIFNNDRNQIIANLAEGGGTDDIKYVSWTNADVDAVNRDVRKLIYTDPAKIELGESIIFKEPFDTYFNNEEIRIEKLEVGVEKFFLPEANTKFSGDGPVKNFAKVELKVYRANDNIVVLHEESMKQFEEIKRTIKTNCNSMNWDWRGYFYFLEQFAQITYNHAISVHKSQGSTFKETIVNVGNINFNMNAEERQRLFYTAVTRASDLLILANVK